MIINDRDKVRSQQQITFPTKYIPDKVHRDKFPQKNKRDKCWAELVRRTGRHAGSFLTGDKSHAQRPIDRLLSFLTRSHPLAVRAHTDEQKKQYLDIL
jgi:hypothetical protein